MYMYMYSTIVAVYLYIVHVVHCKLGKDPALFTGSVVNSDKSDYYWLPLIKCIVVALVCHPPPSWE